MHTSKAIEGVVHRRTTGQSGTVLEVVKQAKARVLIIEDDSQLLSGLQRMLRGQYDVSVACDGQSARNLIAQQE